MPAQKLSYKVDVDTGQAARDLARLGTAGRDAGKDIADGFGDAETASSKALQALSTKLDEVEQDAKGTAEAVAAIKANLTVDVDDSKVEQFAVDLKSKMGVAFDDIKTDAKQFAEVLERGVDLSRTTNEIRGVGTALDHTRGEADQSRSVLANLAGNSAQSLGELGGVVGDLGVGIGQLAEYAVDGNISLKGLAGVAGPMAALAVAGAGVAAVMKNIAETKAFDADQVKAMSEAFAEFGDTSTALAETMDGVFNARVDNDSLWGQLTGAQKTKDLATDLAAVGVTLGDIDAIIRSGASDRASFELLPDVQNLDTILQQAGLSVDAYEAIMDGVFETTKNWTTATDGAKKSAEFFGSTLSTVNQAIKGQLMDENPFAVFDMGLFQTGGHLVDLQAIWNDVVTDMRDDDASFDTTAGNVDTLALAMGKTKEEVIALARETAHAGKSNAEYQQHTEATTEAVDALGVSFADTGRIMAGTDWSTGSIDAAATAMGAFFTDATRGKDAVAGVQEALDNLAAAHEEGGTILPDLSTPEGRQTMGALEALGTSLIPDIQKAFDDSRGSIDTFGQKMDGLYLRTLAQLSDQLGISTEDAALLLRQIGLVPENFDTQYELIGDELAKEQLALLQGVIEGLPTDVQGQIAYAIKMGDYQGAVDLAVGYGSKHPGTIAFDANTSPAKATMDQFRHSQESTPIHVRVQTYGTSNPAYVKPSSSSQSVEPAAAAYAAPAATTSTGGGSASFGWPARTVNLSVSVNAGVVGNRYDVERAVRAAVTDLARLGRL